MTYDCFVTVFVYYLVVVCQYQCNRLPGKTCPKNDLLCVEWDVKLYSLTHCSVVFVYGQLLCRARNLFRVSWSVAVLIFVLCLFLTLFHSAQVKTN